MVCRRRRRRRFPSLVLFVAPRPPCSMIGGAEEEEEEEEEGELALLWLESPAFAAHLLLRFCRNPATATATASKQPVEQAE